MRIGKLSTVFVCCMLAGCGGGGGGDDDPVPVAAPTASAIPPPAVTSTPIPTPTEEPAFDEVLLGVGGQSGRPLPNGGREFTPFVVRNDGGGWERIAIRVPTVTLVSGVTFSTATTAWAYGGRNEANDGVLQRSTDAGRSWVDVSGSLPPDCQSIAELEFADAENGYLVSRGYFSLAYFSTHDGGLTWSAIAVPVYGLPCCYDAVGTRGGVTEVVRYGNGLSVLSLDDPTAPAVVLSPPGEGRIAGSNAFSTVGERGWIAASVPTRRNDGIHTRAAILTSLAPGAAWLEQPVSFAGFTELRAVDVRDEQNGVAGGYALNAAETAFNAVALVTGDGGAAWNEAPISGLPEGWVVVDLLRTRGDGGWAVAEDISTGITQSAFLRSSDGGRSWQRESTAFEADVQIFDLARNTQAR